MKVCGVQGKERGQDLGSRCTQECTADARLVQLNPREHMGSVPAPRVRALVTHQLSHRLMLGARVREASSSLPGLVRRGCKRWGEK